MFLSSLTETEFQFPSNCSKTVEEKILEIPELEKKFPTTFLSSGKLLQPRKLVSFNINLIRIDGVGAQGFCSANYCPTFLGAQGLVL